MMESKLYKKLYLGKVFLTIFQILSVVVFFMLAMWVWSNLNTLKESKEYRKNTLIIDSLNASGKGTGSSKTMFAYGIIHGQKKSVLIQSRSLLRDTISLGDSIPVWNIDGKQSLILRKKNEIKFNESKYHKSNLKIILFGFVPIILLWIIRYLVSKKLKNLEKK